MPPANPKNNPFLQGIAQFRDPAGPDLGRAGQVAQGMFADRGQMADPKTAVAAIHQMTGGAANQMTATQLEYEMRNNRALTQTTGAGMQDMANMATRGAGMAQQVGLNKQFGMLSAQGTAAFGAAFDRHAGPAGFGGLDSRQARGLDQELRMSAANSPLANAMGAAMAAAENGVIQIGNQREKTEMLQRIGAGGPAAFMEEMKRRGVNSDVAAQFLNSKQSNQEQVARHGIADIVRGEQGKEMQSMLANQMSGSFMSMLKGQGVGDPRARRAMGNDMANNLAGAMSDLQRKDPTLFTDPAKAQARNEMLTKQMQAAGHNVRPDMIAGAVRTAEEAVRADPDLAKFGGLGGALGMNNQNVLGAAAAMQGKAAQMAKEGLGKNAEDPRVAKAQQQQLAAEKARQDEIAGLKKEAGIDDKLGGRAFDRAINAKREAIEKAGGKDKEAQLQKLDKLEDMAGRGGKGGGGGGNMKLSGTLTIKADGQGQLDAEGGVPLNE